MPETGVRFPSPAPRNIPAIARIAMGIMKGYEGVWEGNFPSARPFSMEEEAHYILQAAKGNPEAFGALYDRYHQQIYRFVYLKVSTKEDAEDITHQVFLNAWKQMRHYTHTGHPFSSFLYRIARNLVIDHYRAKKAHVALEAAAELPSADAPEEQAERQLLEAEVMRAIRLLKPDYQDVLIMRFIEELSLKEVAAILGKSEGAVKLLQHRAMRRLRQLLPPSLTL
ncbi:sigma-70 family RNA polymerase sigma factor [Candidatus Parcubacteria bacterium]|nr:MAG: sigma-70 family RNA polymerase sigma factor [Candidatus Parcubacteria bacterium]